MQYDDLKRHARLFTEYTELRVQENTAMSAAALNGDIVNKQCSSPKSRGLRPIF